MAAWVLILVVYGNGAYGGPTSSVTQEFATQAACKAAFAELNALAKQNDKHAFGVCVPTGN